MTKCKCEVGNTETLCLNFKAEHHLWASTARLHLQFCVVHTHLSRMVGYRPCQLQQPCAVAAEAVVVLLLVRFCCWYCWIDVVLLTEAEGTSFLVGKSSAAIIFSQTADRVIAAPGPDRTAASGTGVSLARAAENVCDIQTLKRAKTKLHLKSAGFLMLLS